MRWWAVYSHRREPILTAARLTILSGLSQVSLLEKGGLGCKGRTRTAATMKRLASTGLFYFRPAEEVAALNKENPALRLLPGCLENNGTRRSQTKSIEVP